jgi:pyruvate/2-oxoglutarate dehydrogenase complex dihydrolipoamide acyltransferase (E2) component
LDPRGRGTVTTLPPGLRYNGFKHSGEDRGNKGGKTLMKRFIKLVTVAFLVGALIAQRRRVRELSRLVLSSRREEPASEDLGTASRPAGGVGDATRRVDEAKGRAGEPKSRVKATPAAERRAEELGVDLSRVEGTGSGGRITVKDVQSAAAER